MAGDSPADTVNRKAPCWYCGEYTRQRLGSAVFCSWDHARRWDEGRSPA